MGGIAEILDQPMAAASGRDLARLAAAASGELRAERVDLSAMAGEIAAELAKGGLDRAASFDIAPGVHARGDPRLLRMALESLLANAWAATAGNERTEIAFGVRAEGEDEAFFVQDNGVGFATGAEPGKAESLGRLYDAGAFAGAEAALATVQRVVARHGGRTRARGQPGKGASIDFTLPTTRGEGAPARPATWKMIPPKAR